MSRGRRIVLISAVAVVALGIVAMLTGIVVLRSRWFHDKVRDRIVAEVEKATGGRAEIGEFQFDWRTLHARVAPFVLHGKEPAGEAPFLKMSSIDVGLKIVSALEKDVDIESLIVDRPEVRVVVYPDGSTNLPSPEAKLRDRHIADQLLNIAARHFELRNGTADIRDQRLPFHLTGDNLRAVFNYETKGPRYTGHVSSRQLHWESAHVQPVALDFDTDLVLSNSELLISNANLATGRMRFQANGAVRDWSNPTATLDFNANAAVAELARIVTVPIEHSGEGAAQGKLVLNWSKGLQFSAEGTATARGLAYRDARVHINGIGARTEFRLTREGLWLPKLHATALDGTFDGQVSLTQMFDRLQMEGNVQNASLAGLTQVTSEVRSLAWSGTASGPIRIDGRIGSGRPADFTVQANMNIAAAPGAIPIQGSVDFIYDQRARSLRLGNSALVTGATKINISGTLGETLRVSGETKNLDDLLPGLAMISPDAPKTLPLTMKGGSAVADLTVTGDLTKPAIAGRIALGRFESQGQTIDSLSAEINATSQILIAKRLTIVQGGAQVTGEGRIDLNAWRPVDSSAMSGTFNLRGGDIERFLRDAGQNRPVSGTVTGSVRIGGTLASPQASATVAVDRLTAYGEVLNQVRAELQATKFEVRVNAGSAQIGGARVQFTGSYRRTEADWRTGAIRFVASGTGIAVDQFQHVADYKTGLSALATVQATGTAHTRNGVFDLDSLDSQVTLGGITRGGAPVGNLSVKAMTRENTLEVVLNGALRGSEVRGSGRWELTGDYPGQGEIQFTPFTFAALHEVAMQGQVERPLPFVGQVEGRATVTGSLKQPQSMRAVIAMPRIELRSNPAQPLRAGPRGPDLVLRNTEPVQLIATLKNLDIGSAKFAAVDTDLEAAGRISFDAQSPWNATVKGRVNLAILRLFNSDISAQGNAVLDTTVRGALDDPQVNGKLELRGASLYLSDLPAGVDNANGIVTFDRNRANIERLTAEIGGGRINFGGFIGFARGLLLYRVQGNADQVRLRHPDGASVTLNANLNLSGTSDNGLVSGTVTVMRAAFEPRADLGSLLAQTAKPLPAPAAPNEYLRGLNFDVRIESGPSLEVQTSLTRDLQAEADLRLRGNAARPLLAGDISVNQGEIQFLGNKYVINRGDIRFINPTKIEPVLDVDLETKARGITVNISFSGTVNKLNLTYRSDPPLQSNEIIALLAVGRDPTTTAFANAQTRTNLLESGAGTLSQAVAAPVSSRLQRFFGVSRLKIDPQLTGVENIPQARLTLEQQVSRDITLTYITNLTRTQEQIVRVQWDINREWSAIAVREENGVFGIDFQYRKRFK